MRKRKNSIKKYCVLVGILSFLALNNGYVFSWSNGGDSSDAFNPRLGTHDRICMEAIKLLKNSAAPAGAWQWLENNENFFFLGSEAPDRVQVSNCFDGVDSFDFSDEEKEDFGDTIKHHIFFEEDNTTVCDDAAAERAEEEFEKALEAMGRCEYRRAAFFAGAMTHYIADPGVFAHVFDDDACFHKVFDIEEWPCHGDYENWIEEMLATDWNYFAFLPCEGLEPVSAYQASVNVGSITDGGNFNSGGGWTRDCIWMLNHCYDWDSYDFYLSVSDSLSRSAHMCAAALWQLYLSAEGQNNCPEIDLSSNKTIYFPHDYLSFDASMTNPLEISNVNYYAIIDVYGALYFAPDWSSDLNYVTKSLFRGTHRENILRINSLPAFLTPGGPFYVHGALTEIDTYNLIDYDYITFYFD